MSLNNWIQIRTRLNLLWFLQSVSIIGSHPCVYCLNRGHIIVWLVIELRVNLFSVHEIWILPIAIKFILYFRFSHSYCVALSWNMYIPILIDNGLYSWIVFTTWSPYHTYFCIISKKVRSNVLGSSHACRIVVSMHSEITDHQLFKSSFIRHTDQDLLRMNLRIITLICLGWTLNCWSCDFDLKIDKSYSHMFRLFLL